MHLDADFNFSSIKTVCAPNFCHYKHCFQFSLALNSERKLKTVLIMAKIWGANKSFREKWENGEELSTAQYSNKQKSYLY